MSIRYSSVVAADFEDIASRALLALDEEYQSSVTQHNNNSSLDSNCCNTSSDSRPSIDHDEDIKIIAAAFDRRKEEMKRIQQQGGFPVAWDDIQPHPASKPSAQKVEKKNIQDVDVDTTAVRKAVEAISMKNKDAPFQQKFANWQERQKQKQKKHDNDEEPPPHKLIPPVSSKAFYKSTTKAKQATANLTRSATLAEAIVRLSQQANPKITAKQSLLIDVVGVDHVECASVETIQTTLVPFVRWLLLLETNQNTFHYQHVHFRLIGRDLLIPPSLQNQSVDLLKAASLAVLSLSSSSSSLTSATATCHSAVYHDFLEDFSDDTAQTDSNMKRSPDLLIAFNAGIWGYEEWKFTIRYLAQMHQRPAVPFVITAYTLSECQEDYKVILDATSYSGEEEDDDDDDGKKKYKAEVLWEPELNRYGSKLIRETKSSNDEYRENSSWQAWLLGGNTT